MFSVWSATTFFKRRLLALLPRIPIIVVALEPFHFAQVFLDVTSIIGSQIWGGKRSGPDFICPMSTLSKRQSGRLGGLVLEYGKCLSNFESGDPDVLRQDGVPQAATEEPASDIPLIRPRSDAVLDFGHPKERPHAVVVLDLDEVASNDVIHAQSVPHPPKLQYTTPADVDLMVFIPTLLSVFFYSWINQFPFPDFILVVVCAMAALIRGPGTLILVRGTTIDLDQEDGCAVLMDDNLTVVIQGGERLVEAVAEGGFYLSFSERPNSLQEDQIHTLISKFARLWRARPLLQGLYGAFEGGYRGLFESTVLHVVCFFFPVPFLYEIIIAVCIYCCSIIEAVRRGYRAHINNNPQPVVGFLFRLAGRLAGEALGLFLPTVFASPIPTSLLFVAPLLPQVSYFYFIARVTLRSHYPIRTDRFFKALGQPQVRKWPFTTRASAATFACLVLCRDIPRPVKNIDVLGVLETLIPSQRDIWRVWKERVADRIVHEDRVSFAPTVPTFPDERQEHLKRLLDDAQIGYNTYISLPPRRRSRRA